MFQTTNQVVVFYTEKWPAFCGAYPWLTRLPFTAETPERLPAQRRGVDQTQTTTTPTSIVKSWGGWRWNELVNEVHFDEWKLMKSDNHSRKVPACTFMHSLQTIWSFATPIPALILQEVEEILRQQSVHGINIFGEMAQDPASRYGVKEVQGCRHDPPPAADDGCSLRMWWRCGSPAMHGKRHRWLPWESQKAKTSEVVGRFFLCVDSIPSSPQSHEAIRVDPHGFNGQHAE